MSQYDIVKKLKEAGYPKEITLYEDTKEFGGAPNLTELIYACGGFDRLVRVRRDGLPISSMVGDEHDFIFEAVCWEGTKGIGETPYEAVANLWFTFQS